ncbi:MAG: TRAP transporter TatT component family protein [Myxococcales bacterium]
MTATSRSRDLIAGVASILLLAGSTGCSMSKLVANQTAGMVRDGAPALDALGDYELAVQGIPGGIVQLETFYHISPDNPDLGLNLAKAYVGYALASVEHQYEVQDAAGNMDAADELRARARFLYLRARDIGLHQLNVKKKGVDAAVKGGEADLTKYLQKFKSKHDAPALFWAGSAWGAAIDMSRDQPDLIVDLPLAKALVQRAFELDESFYHFGPGMFLGAANSALPEAMGGNPTLGKQFFDTALEKSGRKNLIIQFQMARTYAVNTQNKELFDKLIKEILDAPDYGDEFRLPNLIAKHRAKFYQETKGPALF